MRLNVEIGELVYISVNDTAYYKAYTLISSTVGLTLCLFSFGLLIFTAGLFSEWRKNHKNQLLIQFMMSRILYTLTRYIYDVKNIFKVNNTKTIIYLDAIGITYTECALVCWMFVFSKHLNESLVKVFNTSQTSIWKISLYTWAIPALMTACLCTSFKIQNDKEIVFFFIYLFLVKWPVLCANAVLLITALKAVLKNNKSRTEYNRRIVAVMIILIFGFSFQQILIDAYKIVHLLLRDKYMTYFLNIISILTIYYCAFSIMFWLFGNEHTRKLWTFKDTKTSLRTQSSVSSIEIGQIANI